MDIDCSKGNIKFNSVDDNLNDQQNSLVDNESDDPQSSSMDDGCIHAGEDIFKKLNRAFEFVTWRKSMTCESYII